MSEAFDSFNRSCKPAVVFVAPCFCVDPENLAVMQELVGMEMSEEDFNTDSHQARLYFSVRSQIKVKKNMSK